MQMSKRFNMFGETPDDVIRKRDTRIAALEAALREAIQCLDYVQRSHPGTTGIARRLGAISDGNTLLGPTGDNHG
jgi:hypothetical protein